MQTSKSGALPCADLVRHASESAALSCVYCNEHAVGWIPDTQQAGAAPYRVSGLGSTQDLRALASFVLQASGISKLLYNVLITSYWIPMDERRTTKGEHHTNYNTYQIWNF